MFIADFPIVHYDVGSDYTTCRSVGVVYNCAYPIYGRVNIDQLSIVLLLLSMCSLRSIS